MPKFPEKTDDICTKVDALISNINWGKHYVQKGSFPEQKDRFQSEIVNAQNELKEEFPKMCQSCKSARQNVFDLLINNQEESNKVELKVFEKKHLIDENHLAIVYVKESSPIYKDIVEFTKSKGHEVNLISNNNDYFNKDIVGITIVSNH
jgi:hypothetical protein